MHISDAQSIKSIDYIFVESEGFCGYLKDIVPVIENKKESLSWNDFDDYAECHNAVHKIFFMKERQFLCDCTDFF